MQDFHFQIYYVDYTIPLISNSLAFKKKMNTEGIQHNFFRTMLSHYRGTNKNQYR